MWWVFSLLVILGAIWLDWRIRHGNRQTAKGVGSQSGQHPRGRPRTGDDAPAQPTAAGASPRLGVIPAWRSWRVDAAFDETALLQIRLVSESRLDYWDGPTKQSDLEPTMENSSGIYAAKDWDNHIIPGHFDQGHLRVIGRVGLYGKVIEAERGYRAERCVIEELWIMDAAGYLRLISRQEAVLPLHVIVLALEKRYQVEVHEGGPKLPPTVIPERGPVTHYLPGPSDDDDDGWSDLDD